MHAAGSPKEVLEQRQVDACRTCSQETDFAAGLSQAMAASDAAPPRAEREARDALVSEAPRGRWRGDTQMSGRIRSLKSW